MIVCIVFISNAYESLRENSCSLSVVFLTINKLQNFSLIEDLSLKFSKPLIYLQEQNDFWLTRSHTPLSNFWMKYWKLSLTKFLNKLCNEVLENCTWKLEAINIGYLSLMLKLIYSSNPYGITFI